MSNNSNTPFRNPEPEPRREVSPYVALLVVTLAIVLVVFAAAAAVRFA